jgi:hypothetical protein
MSSTFSPIDYQIKKDGLILHLPPSSMAIADHYLQLLRLKTKKKKKLAQTFEIGTAKNTADHHERQRYRPLPTASRR